MPMPFHSTDIQLSCPIVPLFLDLFEKKREINRKKNKRCKGITKYTGSNTDTDYLK